MSSYPKWLYHYSKPATVVPDEAAHKALGAGWVESPADTKPEAPPEPKPATEPKPTKKK
jgi:hypothetical protein